MDKKCLYRHKPHWSYPIHAVLSFTENCNLACPYCFVSQAPHNMSYEIAKDTVDWLYKNYEFRIDNRAGPAIPGIPRIVYFGGEPTLRWDDIIVPLTNYIRSTYSPFGISMTTNGTLLNKERIDFLAENNIGILISMDGDKPTQDLTRPCRNGGSSFDLMLDNVKYLLEIYPDINMRATINPENAGELFNNYLFAEKIGFQSCAFVTNKRIKWEEKDIVTLENEVAKIYDYYIDHFKQETIPTINFGLVNSGFYSVIELNSPTINASPPIERIYASCGFARNYLAVNYEGKLFACQQQIAPGTKFEIGDIYNGIDPLKQITLLDEITAGFKHGLVCENPEVCKTCKMKRTCQASLCVAAIADRFTDFHTIPEITCRYKNAFINNALRANEILKDNQFFKDYIRKLCDPYYKKMKMREEPD